MTQEIFCHLCGEKITNIGHISKCLKQTEMD